MDPMTIILSIVLILAGVAFIAFTLFRKSPSSASEIVTETTEEVDETEETEETEENKYKEDTALTEESPKKDVALGVVAGAAVTAAMMDDMDIEEMQIMDDMLFPKDETIAIEEIDPVSDKEALEEQAILDYGDEDEIAELIENGDIDASDVLFDKEADDVYADEANEDEVDEDDRTDFEDDFENDSDDFGDDFDDVD